MRPPRRRCTGTSGSFPAARREPAKRRSIPPLFDERRHFGEGLAIEAAYIGKNQDRHLLVHKLVDGIRHAAVTGADFRVGRQRPLDVEDRGQERLGLIEGAAEDETDAAAFTTLVQKVTAPAELSPMISIRAMAFDFGRRIERHLGVVLAARK